MKLADVREKAFAMPLNDPSYPRGPYRFYNREFVVITYRTDIDRLREVVPEPFEVAADTVAYEFIRMPDSTGFGDYTETGQVIPVRFRGADGAVQEGSYVHAMYLDDNSPIAGGREIWGFPKKLATSEDVARERDHRLHAALRLGALRVGDDGLQTPRAESGADLEGLARPNFMIKIIPHVDCTPRICELVRYHCEDVTVKGAWSGPAGDPALRARDVRRRAAAGPRSDLGQPLCHRPHARPRHGRLRLLEIDAPSLSELKGIRQCLTSMEKSPSSPAPPAASARKSRCALPPREAPR